ncbi:toprim domain-containing protein [Campylobacter fetus]|uniref:toprim domain-containing protein n=1 Tax=Campylobacter fetus TaxID=196 RepID=UPI00399CA251
MTLGSATSLVPNEYLHLFNDLKIIICYDHDEAGMKGAKILLQQLKDICCDIKVLNWGNKLKKLDKSFKPFKGFDFTDFLILKKG